MKKKMIAILLACALAVGTAVSPAGMEPARAEESDDGILYDLEAEGAVITGYGGSRTDLVIPDSIAGKQVTRIGEYAFLDNSDLRSVTLPEGLVSIGSGAFMDCDSLASVEISASVTEIGEGAFSGCDSLASVEISASVTEIGEGAFSGCSSLKEILVDQDNAHYVSIDGALYNKEGTELICWPGGKNDIHIKAGVTGIGTGAFSGCDGLISIEIPAGVTKIGDRAFSGCSGLISIQIPAGVTEIGEGAFCYCSSLISIKIPVGVTSIENNTFRECGSLESVLIPAGVTEIGSSAFSHCVGLTNIALPAELVRIGLYAFVECDKLKDVYYAGSEEQWNKIEFGWFHGLSSDKIHFLSSGPSDGPNNGGSGDSVTQEKSVQSVEAKNMEKTYGAKPFSLGAKSSAGAPLSYASSDQKVAVIDASGKVTVKGCGVTSITISAAETAGYKAAQKTVLLTVRPRKAALASVKSKKKKTAEVKWKRSKAASGYVVQCATDKKFKKNKKQTTVSTNKTLSKTMKKLKGGKKYYVRVCAYAKAGGGKIQGDWSKTETVKVKK